MKKEVFKIEISYIKNEKYKKSAEELIEKLPDYFFKVPASSTGKYHPDFALGDGGLVRHTKVAVKIANELLNSIIGNTFTSDEKDLMILSLILHDGLKHGEEYSKYCKFEHPLIACNFIKKNNTILSEKELEFVTSSIAGHMGPYNTNDYSDIVLPIPKGKYQKFVHMCDLLASRKFLDIKFKDNEIIS